MHGKKNMNKYSKITIFGDSLALCNHLDKNQQWTELLRKKIQNHNKEYRLYVKAFNGITTTEALNKINFDLNYTGLVLIIFGTNDSVYYKSLKGKPRVNLRLFYQNYVSIINKIKKKKKNKIFLINGHKFLRKRLEGNKKTHNFSYMKYKSYITKIAKKTNSEIIDTYSELSNLNPKKYCMPLPDGLHQNLFGSKKYSKIIYDRISFFL